MKGKRIFDIIGIGIGPFNLGLAALCYTIPELDTLFLDQNENFTWHAGMMIPGSKLQVPFYADLVTLADPCNPFSYLSYLKALGKMFRFAIRENYFIQRSEYNDYCRWVVSKLLNLKFNTCCTEIHFHDGKGYYEVKSGGRSFFARHLVIGIGTIPYIPKFAENIHHQRLLHSSAYLFRKDILLRQRSVCIIGSGQSAAEIFNDLVQHFRGELFWFSRSRRFYPMDYTSFALEMTSPDYIDHFFSLDPAAKSSTLASQDPLYKGINTSLIAEIYERLSDSGRSNFHLHPNCTWENIKGGFELEFYHTELKQSFMHSSDAVIMATGYQSSVPKFLHPIRHRIRWNDDQTYKVMRNYAIDEDATIFVQNAELHTHGFNAPDLGMGPYRNATILNRILGREHFQIERNVCFQNFGLPKHVKEQG